MTMTAMIGGVAMMDHHGRQPTLAAFRRHMLEGDYWRTTRRVKGEAARFRGAALHRTGSGRDGQEGPRQFAADFLEFLEQGLVDERIGRALKSVAADIRNIEEAMAVVERDRPEEVDALRFYLVPEGRRSMSVLAKALDVNLSTSALRAAASRGVLLVWDELGGSWSGHGSA